jgi:hypothetical protein
MVINVNNGVSSSDNNELSGRAQNGTINDTIHKTTNIKRSYFQELERGPAKVPPKLENTFNLDESLSNAFTKALDFANKVLLDDDMTMVLQDKNGEKSIIVKNIKDTKVMQEYNPIQILQMYSSNYNLQGIVVDALI